MEIVISFNLINSRFSGNNAYYAAGSISMRLMLI